MAAVLDLPLSSAIDYLMHAIEKDTEARIWDLWTSIYPYMALKRIQFISFKNFKNQLVERPKKLSNKPLEEIEEEMSKVVSAYEGQVKANGNI